MANHTDGQVLTVLGVLYNLSREFPNAEAAFKQALAAEPMNHSLWSKLSLLSVAVALLSVAVALLTVVFLGRVTMLMTPV
jgi:Flp pilus assembly protein TadD